jgi:hypothetical protein
MAHGAKRNQKDDDDAHIEKEIFSLFPIFLTGDSCQPTGEREGGKKEKSPLSKAKEMKIVGRRRTCQIQRHHAPPTHSHVACSPKATAYFDMVF